MRVRFTATALAELNDIYDYIAKDHPMAAKAVVLRIEQVVAHIAKFPNMRAQSTPRVYAPPRGSLPYLDFYTVGADAVIIRNVRHGKRRPPGQR